MHKAKKAGHLQFDCLVFLGNEIPDDFVKEPCEPNVSECMDMVKGVANAVHAAAPLMQNTEGQTRDKAILVSGSESSFVNFSMNPMYAMAKHTTNAAAYTYADRLRPHDCPGGLQAHEWTPIDQCIDTFMQGIANVNQTGTVLRLSGPEQEPREMTCEFSSIGSIERWAPPFSKNKTAREMMNLQS